MEVIMIVVIVIYKMSIMDYVYKVLVGVFNVILVCLGIGLLL